jgi:hypothetical protein
MRMESSRGSYCESDFVALVNVGVMRLDHGGPVARLIRLQEIDSCSFVVKLAVNLVSVVVPNNDFVFDYWPSCRRFIITVNEADRFRN